MNKPPGAMAKREVRLKNMAPCIFFPVLLLAICAGCLWLSPSHPHRFAYSSFFGAVVLFVVYGWKTMKDEMFLLYGDEVFGHVAETTRRRHQELVSVEYTYAGIPYRQKWSAWNVVNHKFGAGQNVTIFLDPAKPENFTVLEGGPFELVGREPVTPPVATPPPPPPSKCGTCGALAETGSNFCDQCGASLHP